MRDAFTNDVIAEIDKPDTDKTATKTTLRETRAAIVPSPTATAVPAVQRAAASKMPPGHKLVDPFTLFAEEEGSGVFFGGDYLNFNGQTGAWTRGSKKEPIGLTVPFICNIHELHRGRVKMVDGKIVDRQIGRVFDGYVPPAREVLDDLDRQCWPLNKRGDREDPWLEASYLPLRSLEDGEMVVFSPFSKTARKALGDFVGVYRRADRNGKFPVVALKSRSFVNQSGGLTYVPVFEIIGWEFWADDTPAPEPQPVLVPITPPAPANLAPAPRHCDIDMDDEIPF